MDVKNINKFFVAADCARTTGVELDPDGTYLGKGELVITNEAGTVLDGAKLADNDQFKIYLRGKNGEPIYRSQTLNTSDIKSVYVKQHEDTSHLAYFVSGFDSSPVEDDIYVVKLHDDTGDDYYNPYSFTYRVEATDTDGTTLIENIATKFNEYFSAVDNTNVTSSYEVVDGTQTLMVRGQDYTIDINSGETFEVPSFDVEAMKYSDGERTALNNFDNKGADVTIVDGTGTATISQFTRGTGSYEHVGSMEFHTRGYMGDNKITYPHHPYNITLEAEDYDGTGYDLIVMNGVNKDTDGLGGNTSHPYQVTIALPVASNGTSQASDIYDVLNGAFDVKGTLT